MKRERGLGIKSGIKKEQWEDTTFPIACSSCLGNTPYLRMLKIVLGQQCRICQRPFTVFKWKPQSGRFKRTQACQNCAKKKNICQVCFLDLEFGLSMQLRDKRIGEKKNCFQKPLPPQGPPPQLIESQRIKIVPIQKQTLQDLASQSD